MKRVWNYLLAEPFRLLFNYLLHPFDLNSEVEINQPTSRIVPMLKLALPMFIFSSLVALAVRVFLFPCSQFDGFSFLIFIALATAMGTVGGILSGIVGGIKWGFWSGVGSSIIMGIFGGLMGSTGGLTVGLMALGSGLGVGLGRIESTRESSKKRRMTIIVGWNFLRLLLYILAAAIAVFVGGWGGGGLGGFLESLGIDSKNGIIFGIVMGTTGGIALGGLYGFVWGGNLGEEKGKAWSAKRNMNGNFIGNTAKFIGIIIGILLGIIFWGLIGGVLGSVLGGLMGGFSRNIFGDNVKIIGEAINGTSNSKVYNIPGSTTTGIGFGILVGSVFLFLFALFLEIVSTRKFIKQVREYIREGATEILLKAVGMKEIETVEAIGLATLTGIAGGILGGIVTYIASNWAIGFDITGALVIASACFASFYLGYLQLLLYPLSRISINWAYRGSTEHPYRIFNYLHNSSLYWNKRLPLDLDKLIKLLSIAVQQNPGQALQEINFILAEKPEHISVDELAQLLVVIAKHDPEQALQEINFILAEKPEYIPANTLRKLLHIIAEHDPEQALQEINFILAEKPEYIPATQTVWIEITTRKLEICQNLHDIAKASQEIALILQEKSSLIPSGWVTNLAFLDYAARKAAHYSSPLPLSWRTRREALKEMIAYLKRADSSSSVVNKWRDIAQVELEELEKVAVSWIDNPYTAGPALELRNSLFVGRRDLVRQLEDALSRGRRRPTFFLHGERRMGKSSTLKQLPDMLDSHYLPIFYDLQVRGTSSSIAAFLSTLTKEIYEMTASREISIEKLEEERLKEAEGKNEAAVYYVFDEWFKDVEHKLEQEDRTLLLTFDEFEKLGEAGQAKYLNLNLLLDWFRSVVQNHPRLALLFSGVSNLEEMSIGTGINWAGYFVNVRRLKVSFLKPEEALKLITEPVPNFPGEQIFGEDVIKEIMRVTGCHPFLVQAVCETLIVNLNADKRDSTEISDVTAAVNQVLANWWDTYFRDLWVRTDQNQRICLNTMSRLDISNLEEITQQSKLDDKIARNTLLVLLERDLIMPENENYRISTPIFTEWVKRNN